MNQPKQIQWILCDLGKTLVNFDHEKVGIQLLNVIKKQNPTSPSNPLMLYAWFFMRNDQGVLRNEEIDTGRMSIEQVWKEFTSDFSTEIDFEEFDRMWHDIFSDQHDNVINAMKNAQKKGVHVAICSSTNSSHWNHVLEKYPDIASLSEKAFLTFEMGMMKTDPEFFPSIIKDLGIPADQILFIDDKDENLETAKKAGIHALSYQGELPDWDIFS